MIITYGIELAKYHMGTIERHKGDGTAFDFLVFGRKHDEKHEKWCEQGRLHTMIDLDNHCEQKKL